MKLFDTFVKVVDRTDLLLDKVRKTPRKRLDVVPEPIAVHDPFAPVEAAPKAPEAPREVPLGDPALAAQVYGKRTCEWSGRAVQLLREGGVDARFINLDEPEHRHLEVKLVAATKQYTLPYVYLAGQFVGGYDALAERMKTAR
ncbi:MAG: glutaredoxin [Polyangiaceae bacterium]